MSKKVSYVVLGIFVLIVGVSLYVWTNSFFASNNEKKTELTFDTEESKPSMIGGAIVYTEGAVEMKKASQDQWMRVEDQVDISEGDAVEVVGTGRAIVNLDDGSALRLNSDSSITFTKLSSDEIIVTQERGEVYSRVVRAERKFFVKTDLGTYESLGTAYKVFKNADTESVDVYEKKITFTKEDNRDAAITIDEGKKYDVKNTKEKEKEEKIQDIPIEDLKKNEFVLWNKEKDEEEKEFRDKLGILDFNTEEKDEEESDEVDKPQEKTDSSKTGIFLSGAVVDTGIEFSWTVSQVSIEKGFKIVKSTEPNPVFPGNSYQYITNPEQRSYTWKIADGKTYYFRVCQYLGEACGVYSNGVKITAPLKTEKVSDEKKKEEPVSSVKSISLSKVSEDTVSWKADGVSSLGYKIVWSKTSGPTYPLRSQDKYIYLSDPNASSTKLTPFDGDGLYYVRVCEYLGGKCGKYSNEIKMELSK